MTIGLGLLRAIRYGGSSILIILISLLLFVVRISGQISQISVDGLDGVNGITIEGYSTDDMAGYKVANAGDFNGDGVADFMFSAPKATPKGPGGQDEAGEVYVVFGGVGGHLGDFIKGTPDDLPDGTYTIINGGADKSLAGISVSAAGDVNCDGIDDIIIGNLNPGGAYVLFGNYSHPKSINIYEDYLNGHNGFHILCPTGKCGSAVASAGDVNSDGCADLLIGAYSEETYGSIQDAGVTYLLYGNSTDFAVILDVEDLILSDNSRIVRFYGFLPFNHTGGSVAGLGDIDNDGKDDFIIGSGLMDEDGEEEGGGSTVYVILGRESYPSVVGLNESVDFMFRIEFPSAFNPSSFSRLVVASAGNINGDDYMDIAVGCPYCDVGGTVASGQVYVLYGGPTFPSVIQATALNGTNGFIVNGLNSANDLCGSSLSAVRDFNTDGYHDLIIGSPGALALSGRAAILLGGPAGIFSGSGGMITIDNPTAVIRSFVGKSAGDNLGASVAGLIDWNGDGLVDVIFGATNAKAPVGGIGTGSIYVIYGNGTAPTFSPTFAPSDPSHSPTLAPSFVPSHLPSISPTFTPTEWPTEIPTLAPTMCPENTFASSDQYALSSCWPCPANSNSSVTGALVLSCTCRDGFENVGAGVGANLSCAPCGEGLFSSGGEACAPCAAGSRPTDVSIDGGDIATSSQCILCPMNTYAKEGSATCTACAAGRVTPSTGSPDKSFCVNPASNFAMGSIALAITVIYLAFYIGQGRFLLVAIKRRKHLIYPLVAQCMSRSHVVFSHVFSPSASIKLPSPLKVCLFLSFGVGVVMVCAIFYYVVYVYVILINTMILWRGLGYSVHIDLMARIDTFLQQLSMNIPWFVLVLFYPLRYLYDKLAVLQISLGSLNVTCEGSQASVGLLINLVIFGIAVIFIESDYQIFWSTTLQTIQRCTLYKIGYKWWVINNLRDKLSQGFVCLLVVGMSLFVNPFQIMLRYLMGFLEFKSFTQNHDVLHDVTPACNKMPEARLIDSVLGYSSSAIVIWLVIPVLYIICHVLTPAFREKVTDRLKALNYKYPAPQSALHNFARCCGGSGLACRNTRRLTAADAPVFPTDIKTPKAMTYSAKSNAVDFDTTSTGQHTAADRSPTATLTKLQFLLLSYVSPDMFIVRFADFWSDFLLRTCTKHDKQLNDFYGYAAPTGAEEDAPELVDEAILEGNAVDGHLNAEAVALVTAAAAASSSSSSSSSFSTTSQVRKNAGNASSSSPNAVRSIRRSVPEYGNHEVVEEDMKAVDESHKKRKASILYGGMYDEENMTETIIPDLEESHDVGSFSKSIAAAAAAATGATGNSSGGSNSSNSRSSDRGDGSAVTVDNNRSKCQELEMVNVEDNKNDDETNAGAIQESTHMTDSSTIIGSKRKGKRSISIDPVPYHQEHDQDHHHHLQHSNYRSIESDSPSDDEGGQDLESNCYAHHYKTGGNGRDFPVYFDLCAFEYNELYPRIKDARGYTEAPLITFLLVYVLGLGHVLTTIGREHMKVAIWKYFSFISVCLGYWDANENTVEAYRLLESEKRYFLNEGRINQHLLREVYVAEVEQRNMTTLLSAVVGTRAIILMVFWNCTIVSVLFVLVCDSPLWVHSERLKKLLPPLFITQPMAMALAREQVIFSVMFGTGRGSPTALSDADQEEVTDSDVHTGAGPNSNPPVTRTEAHTHTHYNSHVVGHVPLESEVASLTGYRLFRVRARALVICTTQGRLMNFLLNVYTFALAVAVLYPAKISLPALLLVRAPYIFGQSLHMFLRFGEILRLDNEDFSAAWALLCCCGCATTSTSDTTATSTIRSSKPAPVAAAPLPITVNDSSSSASIGTATATATTTTAALKAENASSSPPPPDVEEGGPAIVE